MLLHHTSERFEGSQTRIATQDLDFNDDPSELHLTTQNSKPRSTDFAIHDVNHGMRCIPFASAKEKTEMFSVNGYEVVPQSQLYETTGLAQNGAK